MDKYFNATNLQEYLQDIFTWIQIHALNLDNGVQLGVVIVAFTLALATTPTVQRAVDWLVGLRAGNKIMVVTG